MKKEVFVQLCGWQRDHSTGEDVEHEKVEINTAGHYFCRGGEHYIFFEEVEQDTAQITKNQIKITENARVEVRKNGWIRTQLLFEQGCRHECTYHSSYGGICLGVTTREIQFHREKKGVTLQIDYCLDTGEKPFADCCLELKIRG